MIFKRGKVVKKCGKSLPDGISDLLRLIEASVKVILVNGAYKGEKICI